MSTTFPTTIQDLDATRGSTGQPLNNPNHITHHTNEDDTIEALQNKVGVNGSAVATSIDYILKDITGGHNHDGVNSRKISVLNLSGNAAKGDLIVGLGANSLGILSAGVNGYLLTADSGYPGGMRWGPAGSGTVTSVAIAGADVISASGSPITGAGTITLSIHVADATHNGYLSAVDWFTFNSKQAALGFTPENVANKATNFSTLNNTKYPSTLAVANYFAASFIPAGSNTQVQFNDAGVFGGSSLFTFDKLSGVVTAETFRVNQYSANLGAVLFLTNNGLGEIFADVNRLFYDVSSNFLGINLASPAYTLHVGGDAALNGSLFLYSTLNPASYGNFDFDDSTGRSHFRFFDNAYSGALNFNLRNLNAERSVDWQDKDGVVAFLADNVSEFINDANYITLAGVYLGLSATAPITYNGAGTFGFTYVSTDVYSQYAYLAGRSGNQTLIGGTSVIGILKLQGTSGNGTLTAAAVQVLVGNNGATVAATFLNNGHAGFGTTAPNAAQVEILSTSATLPAQVVRGHASGSVNIAEWYRANTAQLVMYVNQYGTLTVYQPANANGVADFQGDGNLGFLVQVRNVNAGANAAMNLVVSTAGGGQAVITIQSGGVNYVQGANVKAKSNGSIFMHAGDDIGNINTNWTYHSQGGGNAYESSAYTRFNNSLGTGHFMSADALGVFGNLAVFNPNAFGGGLGTEMLSEPSLPAGMTKWSATGDCSVVAGGGLLFTYSAGTGTWTQTAANFAVAVQPDTYYGLTITFANVTGACYIQIGDPNGTFSIPVSIQHPQTVAAKFGGTAYGAVDAGTYTYWVKTSPTAASLSGVGFVIKAYGAAAGATFKITAISFKPALGGDIQFGGIIKAFGGTTGIAVDSTGRVKLNAAVNDTITAWLLLPAGSTAANKAPVKFQSGTLMTTAEAGAWEFNGNFYLTKSNAVRVGIPGGGRFDHFANVGNSGTSETDLYSDTLDANFFDVNGASCAASYGGVFVSSATATRQIKIYFAGTVIFDTGALTLSLSSAWTVYVELIRVSSTVVRYMVSLTTQGASAAAYTSVGELTGLTLTGTNILKITGQAAGVGAATNDIVAQMGKVRYEAPGPT